ncbi:unnamed protein product [Lampetra fluviatilis]
MSDWVVDSVVGFLQSPLWADPVMGFIEHRCTVFDPGEENKLSYTDIHREYKELVEGLLESYLQDMGISEQQLLDACSAQSVQSEHLHQVFEPVLAADDFELFKGLMVRKNIELELQALMHLQEQKGVIPECMSVDGLDKAGELDREEMQLLQEAIRASKQQYEMEQRWRRSCILEPGTTEEQEDEEPCREGRPLLQGSIHHQVSECCADVPGPSGRRCSDVADEPPGATGPSQRQAAGASSAPAARQDVPSVPGGSQATQPPPRQLPSEPAGGTSADAVAQQRQQQQPNGAAPPGKAQASKLHETRPKEAAVSLKHNLSAEELRSREEYLRQQRDRLLAAKREQLGSSQRQTSAVSNDRKAPGPGRADACTAGGCGGGGPHGRAQPGAADGDAPRRGPSATGGAVADRPAPAAAATGKQARGGTRTEESQTLEQRKRVAHKLKEELLQKKGLSEPTANTAGDPFIDDYSPASLLDWNRQVTRDEQPAGIASGTLAAMYREWDEAFLISDNNKNLSVSPARSPVKRRELIARGGRCTTGWVRARPQQQQQRACQALGDAISIGLIAARTAGVVSLARGGGRRCDTQGRHGGVLNENPTDERRRLRSNRWFDRRGPRYNDEEELCQVTDTTRPARDYSSVERGKPVQGPHPRFSNPAPTTAA